MIELFSISLTIFLKIINYTLQSNLKSIIKLLTPLEYIFDALEKDFTTLIIRSLESELEKQFIKLLVLEFSLSIFLIQQYVDYFQKIPDEEFVRIFYKGKNVEEKMVYFLKQDCNTNLSDSDLRLLFLRIRRRGNQQIELMNLFKYPEIMNFRKVEVIESLPFEPLTGIKLNDTPLNLKINLEPDQLNSFIANSKEPIFSEDQFQGGKTLKKKKTTKQNDTLPISQQPKGKIVAKKQSKKPVTIRRKSMVVDRKSISSTKRTRTSTTPNKSETKKKKSARKSINSKNTSVNLSNLEISRITKKGSNQVNEQDCQTIINDIAIFEIQYDTINKDNNFNPLQVISIKENQEKEKRKICQEILDFCIDELFKNNLLNKKQANEKQYEINKSFQDLNKSIICSFLQDNMNTTYLKDDPYMTNYNKKQITPQIKSPFVRINQTQQIINASIMETSCNQSYLLPLNTSKINDNYVSPQSQLQSFLGISKGSHVQQKQIHKFSPQQLTLTFFKKILIYNIKIEEIKQSIFEAYKEKINFIKIFEELDQDKDGKLNFQEFNSFLQFMLFNISPDRVMKLVAYFQDSDLDQGFDFIQFIQIFLPSKWTQEETYNYFSNINQEEHIKNPQFNEMRKLLIIIFKKIDDLGQIVKQINQIGYGQIINIVSQNQMNKISLQKLMSYLEQNKVAFLEEDLIEILNEFNIEKSLEISQYKLDQYFKRKIWKLFNLQK